MTEEEIMQMAALRAGSDPRKRFDEMMRSGMDAQNLAMRTAMQKPDTSGLVRLGEQRERLGESQLMQGMMLAGAPKAYQPLSSPTYAAGLGRQGPWQVGEGYYNAGEYTGDPFKRQDRLTKAVQQQAEAGQKMAGEYGLEETRKAQRAASGASAAHSAAGTDLIRQQIETGKLIPFKDASDNPMFMDSKTRQIIDPLADRNAVSSAAPGARQYPETPGLKASEDERRVAYQTQNIAARAPSAFASGASEPGFFESAARASLPGEAGEAVANFLSSAPRQQARQSQEGIVDALLYLATGAAYNKEQLTQARREFLAGYTDDPTTVTSKRAKLATLAESARNRAGRAWTRSQEAQLLNAFPELAQGGAQAPGAGVATRAMGYIPGGK
jgi:hypothetical protein